MNNQTKVGVSGVILAGVLATGASFMSSPVSSEAEFEKVENKLEVKKVVYSVSYQQLLDRKASLEEELANYTTQKQAEIAEIDLYISEAEKLGLDEVVEGVEVINP